MNWLLQKNRTKLLPSNLVTSNGHTVTDEETIAEEFNSNFVNIGNQWLMQYHLVQLVISISLQQTKTTTRFFLRQVVLKKFLML